MPDDKELEKEEKRLRKLAEDIDNAEPEGAYAGSEKKYMDEELEAINELRIKQLQGEAPPPKKPAVTMESVEEAAKKTKAPFMRGGKTPRKDYYDPSVEEDKFVEDHRTGRKFTKWSRMHHPTRFWKDADFAEEKRLVGELKSAMVAADFAYQHGIDSLATNERVRPYSELIKDDYNVEELIPRWRKDWENLTNPYDDPTNFDRAMKESNWDYRTFLKNRIDFMREWKAKKDKEKASREAALQRALNPKSSSLKRRMLRMHRGVHESRGGK